MEAKKMGGLTPTLILLVSSLLVLLVFCSANSGLTTTERVCQMAQQADTEFFPRGLDRYCLFTPTFLPSYRTR